MAAYVRYAPRSGAEGDAGRWGVVVNESVVADLAAPPFEEEIRTGRSTPLDEVELLAPATPSKVIAVGLNFRSHLGGRDEPTEPGLFAKLPSAVIGPGEAIVFPAGAEAVHAEGEIVVVIGRTTRRVGISDAPSRIFGVTAGNDVSERRWQRDDLQWLRAKASDSFGPLGPRIVTGSDYTGLMVETRINGKVIQSGNSRDLIFGIPEIVAYASRYFTLYPGDVIYTGTPGTTAALSPGDLVEVEVEGVGVLANHVEGASGHVGPHDA